MFAVIKTGGKQYRVAENDEIIVEKLEGDAGASVTFDEVLMLGTDSGTTVGAPLVSGASVVGEVAEQRKADKVITVKKRQRSTYRRKIGHRQLQTVVKITSILADGKKAPAKKAAAKKTATPKSDAPKSDPAAEAKVGNDLTKMKGLGKVFAEKLNAEGITTYAQIASMSSDDIATLEEKISAAGKFEKNDWVAQATELAKNS
ncbi:MAG: 50S ribosomal protein L21 [Pseudomonadota bacterium]